MKKSKLSNTLMAILGTIIISFAVYSSGNVIADNTNMAMISHSEYWSNEIGQIVGKLYRFNGDPLAATCDVTIYNPDKTVFLGPQTTDDTLEAADGTHYINFTTPSVEGIYEYKIKCDYINNGKNGSRTISNSFHLNPALNAIKTINNSISSVNLNLQNFMGYADTNWTFQNGQLININTITGQINNTVNGISVVQNYQTGMLQLINSTTQQILVNITGLDSQIKDIRENIFTDTNAFNNFTNIQNNFNVVNTKLDGLNTSIQGLYQYCSTPATNSSILCQLVWDNNNKITDVQNTINNVVVTKLDVINQTTQNTYDYITGTLATNINNIYTTVTGIQTTVNDINSTVNRIDTGVTNIQTNLTTVISNQEDAVYIDVTS